MWWIGLSAIALAAPPEEREVVRLTTELHQLAQRSAWEGVERTWETLSQAPELGAREFVTAAEAATALGDVGAARDRLLAALRLDERRDIVERLWAIDTAWGSVQIEVAGPTLLTAQDSQWLPVPQRAIERAITSLETGDSYVGWLPVGDYRVAGESVRVLPGPTTRRIVVD